MAVQIETLSTLPLGFRFQPTDEELINHYLKGKISGIKADTEVITEIDVCKCEPWDLPGKSLIRSDDPEWFFFAPRDRKYPNGHRSNRATEAGYWKATGKDRFIKSKSSRVKAQLIGKKKTLVFYRGRAPHGERTSWVMHEYQATENKLDAGNGELGAFVLCRLFKKPDEKNVNSNCDEIDEKNVDTNFDEVEQSGLSPTTTKSSPEDSQHAGDAVVQFKTPINQGNTITDKQQESQPLTVAIENQQVNIERWLADKADNGTSYQPAPEDSQCNSYMASDTEDHDAEVAAGEVDPLLQDLEMFYEPEFGWLDTQGLSPMDALGLDFPSEDSPFYDYGIGGQQTGLFQAGPVGQDSSSVENVTEFLDAVLNYDHDEYSSEDSGCPKDSYSEPKDIISSSDGDGEKPVIEVDPNAIAEGSSCMNEGSLSYEDANRPMKDYRIARSFGVPEQNMCLLHNGSAEPEASSVDSTVDSRYDMFNNLREPVQKSLVNNSDNADETGIELRMRHTQAMASSNKLRALGTGTHDLDDTGVEIRPRQPRDLANSHKLVAHGTASRRIRLQRKVSISGRRKVFTEPGFVKDSESSSETESAITEAREHVEDTATTAVHPRVPGDSVDQLFDEEESFNRSSVLDADSNREVSRSTNLRLRAKQSDKLGSNQEGPAMQPELRRSFSPQIAVRVTIIVLVLATIIIGGVCKFLRT